MAVFSYPMIKNLSRWKNDQVGCVVATVYGHLFKLICIYGRHGRHIFQYPIMKKESRINHEDYNFKGV
ncbi:MAG: hypothetical protein L3J69_03210 [Desulfobacula sp.]|nr:hypothetical protein [Desulfobacula sp.]